MKLRLSSVNSISQGFEKLNQQILFMQNEKSIDGGSTALYVTNQNKQLVIAHVGDSSAFIYNKSTKTISKITNEHRLTRPDELERIE